MKIKKKKTRRSDFKVITKEAKVLKFLRESRRLSMRKAAVVLNTSEAYINHSEHGRIDLTASAILKFLEGYGYEYGYFTDLVEGKIELPQNLINECLVLIKRIKPEKLKAVKAILESF